MKRKSNLVKKWGGVFFLLLMFVLNVSAQQTQVRGTVVDELGEPAIGATIQIQGTAQGTITDANGNFTISAPAGGTLVVSFVGYQTQEVPVSANVRVVLSADAALLDELLVIAYGTVRRASFTGSAAVVDSDAIDRRQVSNITKALDGLIPGVQVTSGTGQPGSGSDIFIRGLGSINASNRPLWVVDGIPFDGDISDISPNDIESITVLKDASAGALFGARGANGVVMVTTRRGAAGTPTVNFRANFGIASRAIPRYETMNSWQFTEAAFSAFYNEAIRRGVHPDQAGSEALWDMSQGAGRIFGDNEMYNPFNFRIAQLIDPTTGRIRSDAQLMWEDDWLDEVTRNDAWRQEYTLDVSGGDQRTQYFVSLGFLDHNGILETTRFQRYSGRASVNSRPQDWFGISLSTNFARSESNFLGVEGSSTSNVWYSAQLMGPIFPVFMRDRENGGAFILDEFGNRQFDHGASRPAGQQRDFNSIATLFDDSWNTVRNSFSARGRVDLGNAPTGWTRGLQLSLSIGADYYGENEKMYWNPFFGNAASVSGRVTKDHVSMLSYTATQLLSYNFNIRNLHNFDVMVAHEWYEMTLDRLDVNKSGFPFGGLFQPDAATTLAGGGGSFDVYRINSYFGRLNYNFDDRYYLSASLRRDASSRFHPDHRWGTFWSIGGNYRISEESFMEGTSHWLDNLAIRASYGVQGNDNLLQANGIDPLFYAWQALYDLGWANANMPGAMVTTIENRDLTWERNANFNIGLDISVFRGRLSAVVEYYRRHTSDLLLSYPMALSTGFGSFLRNSGSMLNQGVEVTLLGRIISTRDFQWNAAVMASTMNNRVLKLTESGADIVTASRIIREGEPFRSWFLPRSAGVDPLTGEQLFWATVNSAGETVEPFITNSPVLAANSREIVGNAFPDLSGSISTEFRYKAFDLSIATNFSIGGQMLDQVYNSMMNFFYPAQAKHVDLLQAWRHPGDVSHLPRYEFGTPITTSDMLISSSFFSIRNITLGYTLRPDLAQRAGINSMRLFASADNLHMFTSLRGTNPRHSILGGTEFVFTPERLISFGIDLRF